MDWFSRPSGQNPICHPPPIIPNSSFSHFPIVRAGIQDLFELPIFLFCQGSVSLGSEVDGCKENNVMEIFEKFLKLLSALELKKVEYILVGGYAVILHGFLRATQDIDLFVNPTEDNIARLQSA